ncbi:hypothetical protein ACMFMF_003118 [Clarireedia jacksonii]
MSRPMIKSDATILGVFYNGKQEERKHNTRCTYTCLPFPAIAALPFVIPNASHPSFVANNPTQKPPTSDAIACVCSTPNTSSAFFIMRTFFLHEIHGHPRCGPAQESHHDGAPSSDDPGCGRDTCESVDHAVDSAEDGGFVEVETVAEGPDEEGGGSVDAGVEGGDAGIRGRGLGSAAVEAIPADPDEAGADDGGKDVIRTGGAAVRVVTWTEELGREC